MNLCTSLFHPWVPHIVSVHSCEDAEVYGVGDPSVENQHPLIDHRHQRQPAENLLQQLQDPFAVHLMRNTHTQPLHPLWQLCGSCCIL